MLKFLISSVLLVSLIRLSESEFTAIELTTDQFQLDCILTHNDIREKHCSPPLKYSTKLKSLATRRATILAQTDGRYVTKLPDSTFGENIYRHRYNPRRNRTNCKTIVKNWYRERSRYDPENGVGTQTRRFAQIVWNATKHIGCASMASSNLGGHVYTICNYYNLVRFPFNVTQNVMTIQNCDEKLSHRSFKTKRLTDAHWLQECIHEHNNIRKIHSVDTLTITDEIFQAAHKRATEMAQKGFRFFKHKKTLLAKEKAYGENIHWTKMVPTNESKSISCNVSISKWYTEINNYDWDFRENHNGTTRHFVQMVWKETTTVGCAQVQNIEEKKGGVYTVCLYEPKAEYRDSEMAWENVYPRYYSEKKVEEPAVSAIVVADYEHVDGLDDETELEKEFKDVDDVIDTRNVLERRTPALSLEDIYLKTTTEMTAMKGFDRKDYVHKSKGKRRKR